MSSESSGVLFNELLSIKVLRERRLRRTIIELERTADSLISCHNDVRTRRGIDREKWRMATVTPVDCDARDFGSHLRTMARFRQQDTEAGQDLEKLRDQVEQVRLEQAATRASLKRTLVQQEKITVLLLELACQIRR